MPYWSIYFAFLFYFTLLIKSIKENKEVLTIYNLLLIWYSFSILSNIMTGIYNDYKFLSYSIPLYVSISYLFIRPFKFIKNIDLIKLKESNKRYSPFIIVSIILIIINFLAIFKYSTTALNTINANSLEIRTGLADIVYSQKYSFFDILISFGKETYFVCIIFFFIGRIRKYNYILTSLLLISSFSKVIFHLSQAGRTGFVFWVFSFLMCIILFKKQLKVPELKNYIKILFSLFLFFAFIFVNITIQRFSDGYLNQNEASAFTSVLDYYGQGIVHFDEFLRLKIDKFFYGFHIFPLVLRLLTIIDLNPFELSNIYATIRSFDESNWYYFSSFIRELIYNFGVYGTIIISIIYSVCLKKIFQKQTKRTLGNSLLIFYAFVIPFFGLFSLSICSLEENAILFILLITRKIN